MRFRAASIGWPSLGQSASAPRWSLVCSPNDPTGTVVRRIEMMVLAERGYPRTVAVVPDEACCEFVDDPECVHGLTDRGALSTRLVGRGAIVCPADGRGQPTHVRATVGTPDENEMSLRALPLGLGCGR